MRRERQADQPAHAGLLSLGSTIGDKRWRVLHAYEHR